MDKNTVAHDLAFEIMQNLLGSHGEGFDKIKNLKDSEKNDYAFVIKNVLLDYFQKKIIKI